MRILAIGDVTSPEGLSHLAKNLWKYREENKIDFVIANGENASFITGISEEGAVKLLRGGADCITGGNHTLRNRKIYTYIEEERALLRPINFGDAVPGRGYAILDANGYSVLVINAMGVVNIEPRLNSPYGYIDKVLSDEAGRYDVAVLDIHAEATGEKLALGYAYDGKINIIFGTHTHVPTADERILPNGTGYITDIGMCGPIDSVLGVVTKCSTDFMITHLRGKGMEIAKGPCKVQGIFTETDDSTGKALSIERFEITDPAK